MPIGTSAGEHFEDAFEHSTSDFRPITGSGQVSETNVRPSVGQDEASNTGTRTFSIIRHGATHLNSETGSDRIRGHSDVPLSEEGVKEAHALGKQLQGGKNNPDLLVSSDLQRASHTADIVSQHSGIPFIAEHPGLRPWHVGEHTGKLTSESIPILADYAANKPDEKVPGGESFNEFRNRFFSTISGLAKEYPDHHIGLVTHYRNDRLIDSWLKNGAPEDGEIDKKSFLQKGGPTGDIKQVELPIDKLQIAGDDKTNTELGALMLVPAKRWAMSGGEMVQTQTKWGESGSYNIVNDQGEKVGNVRVRYNSRTKNAHIDMIDTPLRGDPNKVSKTALEANRSSQAIGPKEIRSLVQEARRLFPDIETIDGLRISGGREHARQTNAGNTRVDPVAAIKVPPAKEPTFKTGWSLRAAPEDINRLESPGTGGSSRVEQNWQ